jgi:hypothetical protein
VATATHTRRTTPARTLISSVRDGRDNDFEIWAELEACDRPGDTARLRFQSRWTGARDPDALHNQGEFYLDATGIDNLRRLLGAK